MSVMTWPVTLGSVPLAMTTDVPPCRAHRAAFTWTRQKIMKLQIQPTQPNLPFDIKSVCLYCLSYWPSPPCHQCQLWTLCHMLLTVGLQDKIYQWAWHHQILGDYHTSLLDRIFFIFLTFIEPQRTLCHIYVCTLNIRQGNKEICFHFNS